MVGCSRSNTVCAGIILLGFGILFMLGTTGIWPEFTLTKYWPLLLIVFGLHFILCPCDNDDACAIDADELLELEKAMIAAANPPAATKPKKVAVKKKTIKAAASAKPKAVKKAPAKKKPAAKKAAPKKTATKKKATKKK